MSTPAIVVGGTASGVGKTSVALGLMRALADRGETVQPFKVGPDFIDPLHHRATCGRVSYNLDGWMMGESGIGETFRRASRGADVAVVEGVMGLFDGYGPETDAGSTAEVAATLGAPVVLVVDAWNMAGSAAAVVAGFAEFDPDVRVEAVIFNRVAGAGHLALLREAVEEATDVPVLGGLPRDDVVEVPERHLGLHLPDEESASESRLDRLGALVADHVDVDGLISSADSDVDTDEVPGGPRNSADVRVGVARDDAFCFYYDENFDRLEQLGCELVPFSPVADEWPEDLDGVYLGGGYPERHLEALQEASRAAEGVASAIRDGVPVLAECGGLMWLGEWIELEDGTRHQMVGALPLGTRMTGSPKLAYVEVAATEEAPFFPNAASARGHVFHHSEAEELTPGDRRDAPYRLATREGDPRPGGWRRNRALASYVHLHFGSCPAFARAFVEACRDAVP